MFLTSSVTSLTKISIMIQSWTFYTINSLTDWHFIKRILYFNCYWHIILFIYFGPRWRNPWRPQTFSRMGKRIPLPYRNPLTPSAPRPFYRTYFFVPTLLPPVFCAVMNFGLKTPCMVTTMSKGDARSLIMTLVHPSLIPRHPSSDLYCTETNVCIFPNILIGRALSHSGTTRLNMLLPNLLIFYQWFLQNRQKDLNLTFNADGRWARVENVGSNF